MTALYLKALLAIAASLSVLMAGAWVVQQRTGIPPLEAQMLRSRGGRYRDYRSRTSPFFPWLPQA